MKLYIILVKFLFIGALFIISNQNLHIGIQDERNHFFDLYYSWLDNLFGQVQHITSYVVNSEWLPSNGAGGDVSSVG